MYNVLQLIDSFYQGGTERQTVQLTRLLHESGRYRLRLACLRPEGPLRAEVERLGFTDIPSFPLDSFYDRNMAAQLRRFVRYLRENEIDLVHAHDFYMNVFGMAGATLARVPVRLASRRDTEGVRSPAQRWVERRAYDMAHAVVANAEAVREQVIKEGTRPEKVVRIYNGLDVSRLAPPAGVSREEMLQSLDLPRAAPRRFVTIVANMLHPMKDQGTFLRAARRVRETVPDAAFVLAGDGGLTERWRALAAELGLQRDAFFVGRCARVAELLSISEVCVLSSKGVEGLSNSIIEYMAAGRPVVATDIGGAREAVTDGETGYVVRPEDDEAMAARIVSLLREPGRARAMGARGREIASRKFSLGARLEATEQLYDRLLLERAAAPAPARGVEGVRRGDV
ncbi:MAG: glycosyltransferase [Acidobacteria bacterium]|nr:glycosyltransferase [Acidobacteriota bacterium]